jgi:hypothetical protein
MYFCFVLSAHMCGGLIRQASHPATEGVLKSSPNFDPLHIQAFDEVLLDHGSHGPMSATFATEPPRTSKSDRAEHLILLSGPARAPDEGQLLDWHLGCQFDRLLRSVRPYINHKVVKFGQGLFQVPPDRCDVRLDFLGAPRPPTLSERASPVGVMDDQCGSAVSMRPSTIYTCEEVVGDEADLLCDGSRRLARQTSVGLFGFGVHATWL